MNREQMVEKAARAEHQHGLDIGVEYCEWDQLPGSVRDSYRNSVAAALDAILPQVTTVEELEALPIWSVVLDLDGSAWTRRRVSWECLWAKRDSHLLFTITSLTLVFRGFEPEPQNIPRRSKGEVHLNFGSDA